MFSLIQILEMVQYGAFPLLGAFPLPKRLQTLPRDLKNLGCVVKVKFVKSCDLLLLEGNRRPVCTNQTRAASQEDGGHGRRRGLRTLVVRGRLGGAAP